MTTTAFLMFFGAGGASAVEERLDAIKVAIGASVLRRAREAGYSPLVAVTSDAQAAQAFAKAGADVQAPRTEPFGRQLPGPFAGAGSIGSHLPRLSGPPVVPLLVLFVVVGVFDCLGL